MAFKKLSQFNYFDIDGFLEKIRLTTTGQSIWKDFDSGKPLGTKVEVAIAVDKHNYNTVEGEKVSNIHEKFKVKIPKEIDVPMDVEVRLVNPEASIYGDYHNQLSVTAENIEVVKK